MKSYPNPLYTNGSGLYSHYEVEMVSEYLEVNRDNGTARMYCEAGKHDPEALRRFWTVYGRFNPNDGAGAGREALIDVDTEESAMEHLKRMGIYPAVKLFLIMDGSGRGIDVVRSESAIRKHEDPDNPTTMDDGKELYEFLDDAEIGEQSGADCDTYIRVL